MLSVTAIENNINYYKYKINPKNSDQNRIFFFPLEGAEKWSEEKGAWPCCRTRLLAHTRGRGPAAGHAPSHIRSAHTHQDFGQTFDWGGERERERKKEKWTKKVALRQRKRRNIGRGKIWRGKSEYTKEKRAHACSEETNPKRKRLGSTAEL